MAKAKYTRGKDGYFKTNVWDGTYKENGKKHYVPMRTKQSSKKLEELVENNKNAIEQRKKLKPTETTFIEYARLWLSVYKSSREANTITMYENIIEKHLYIITEKIPNTDRIHIQKAINNASGKVRTQQQILMTAKQIVRSAVFDHYFSVAVYEDIFNNIDKINYKPPEKRPLEDYEKTAVFEAEYAHEMDKIYVFLVYGCGLRREETTALSIFDFVFKDKNEVIINKAFEYTSNNPRQKEPKTTNGYRSVPIPDKVLPDVKNYVQWCMKNNQTLLFQTQSGKPMTKSSYRRMWERIITALQEVSTEEITGLTSHIFRHNFTTMLCYQIPKISIKRIAQLVGDTEAVVLKIYNHIIMEKEDADGAVNAAMNF